MPPLFTRDIMHSCYNRPDGSIVSLDYKYFDSIEGKETYEKFLKEKCRCVDYYFIPYSGHYVCEE